MGWLVFLACWTAAERDEVLRVSQMFEHDDLALSARDAVLRGDLKTARRAGAALAGQPTPAGLGDAAGARMALVHRSAVGLAQAADARAAAEAIGGLAYACGACHRAPEWQRTGDAVPDGVGSLPPRSEDTDLHRWGVERMWDGVVWSRDDWYATGLEVYQQAIERPVPEAALPTAPAETEQDHLARSARLAQVLGTCAACHERASRPGVDGTEGH